MSVDTFRAQIQWLRTNAAPIGLADFGRCLKRPKRGRPFILVTFDDGYKDFLHNALPILQEAGIPATMFLPTKLIDNGGLIWNDEIVRAFWTARAPRVVIPWLKKAEWPLLSPDDRRTAARAAVSKLKTMDDHVRATLQTGLMNSLEPCDKAFSLSRQFMTWNDIRSVRDYVTFGGHSHSHRIMSRLQPSEVFQEVSQCIDRLTAELGYRPTAFAYPNGRRDDFDATCQEALRQHGIRFAFTTIGGINTRWTDPLALRRIPTGAPNIGNFVTLVGSGGFHL